MWWSRHFISGIAALFLGGCALENVQKSQLQQVAVDRIPERAGQILRLALLRRFGSSDHVEAGKAFDLQVTLDLKETPLGIGRDALVRRVRIKAIASYVLKSRAPGVLSKTGRAVFTNAYEVLEGAPYANTASSHHAREMAIQGLAEILTMEILCALQPQKT